MSCIGNVLLDRLWTSGPFRNFVHSLYPVQRFTFGIISGICQYFSWSLKHEDGDQKLEELIRDELREELRIQNQSVEARQNSCNASLTEWWKKKASIPPVYPFEVAEAKSTTDPLARILEKLSAVNYYFVSLTAKVDQQEGDLAAISTKAARASSCSPTAIHIIVTSNHTNHCWTNSSNNSVANATFTTVAGKTGRIASSTSTTTAKKIGWPTCLSYATTVGENGGTIRKGGKKISDTHQQHITGGSEVSLVMIGKFTTSKIPTFDGSGPWKLYHKQFNAAAAHNQWGMMQKSHLL